MEGNLMVVIPLSDIDNVVPTNVGNAWKKYNVVIVDDEPTEVVPTFRRLAEICKPLYGQPLQVPWSDNKFYVLIEMDASWFFDEMQDFEDLRIGLKIQKGDKSRAEYARLSKGDVKRLLSQIPSQYITAFNEFIKP